MPPKPKQHHLTHFLCLPLVSPTSRPQLQSSIQRFAAEVTTPNDSGEAALPVKAIRPVGSIHLTIGVMSLPTPERVAEACNYLKGLDVPDMLGAASDLPPVKPVDNNATDPASSVLPPPPPETTDLPTSLPPPPPPPPLPPQADNPLSPPPPHPEPLTITLSGLHSLRPVNRTSSLHAAPHPDLSSPNIHPFANLLRTAFTSAGFLIPEEKPLKLHATIVNTIYARRAPVSGKMRWRKGSGRFDASALVERYKDVVWAKDFRLEKVAICEMGAAEVRGGKEGEGKGEEKEEGQWREVDKEYKEVASVELP